MSLSIACNFHSPLPEILSSLEAEDCETEVFSCWRQDRVIQLSGVLVGWDLTSCNRSRPNKNTNYLIRTENYCGVLFGPKQANQFRFARRDIQHFGGWIRFGFMHAKETRQLTSEVDRSHLCCALSWGKRQFVYFLNVVKILSVIEAHLLICLERERDEKSFQTAHQSQIKSFPLFIL